AQKMACSPDLIAQYDDYCPLNKSEYYFLNNRVRKFTYYGLKHLQSTIENRLPFFDNRLIEYLYALPDELRYQSFIYKKVLLSFFPDFFQSIPWKTTSMPITYPRIVRLLNYGYCGIMKFSKNLFKGTVDHRSTHKDYTDYANWIRTNPACKLITDLLKDSHALYPNYIPKHTLLSQLDLHMSGRTDYTHDLMTAVTFELWLQQVYEGKYREGIS
ncbi:MAG: hypothetical protein GF384_08350, partial [Elusimicrobia bacterium]|nr:hypothetical protein [Elusimicrobiota bacterium]MBD3412638.1 hypothetical protein [Elusimicrobiota bacterium]